MPPKTPKPTPQKRPPGSGSVRAVARGELWGWRASFPSGRRGRTINAGTYRDESEAHARLDALCEAHSQGLVPAAELTVAQWVEQWVEDRANDGVHANASSERGHMRHAIETDIGHVPLDALTARDVRHWAAALKHRPKLIVTTRGGKVQRRGSRDTISYQSQIHALKILRGALTSAVEDDRIPANPAVGVRIAEPRYSKAKRANNSLDYLTGDQVTQLLSCPHLRPEVTAALSVAVYAALRVGELAGLQWGDIEGLTATGGWICVRRTWAGAPPKNGKARRVPILPRLAPRLLAWRDSCADTDSEQWVFPSPRKNKDGSVQFSRGYDWGWAEHRDSVRGVRPGLLEQAGIDARIRLHDLRDTCATHLLSGTWSVNGRGWPIEQISRMLGHADIRITIQRYAHLTEDALSLAAANILPESEEVGSAGGSAGSVPAKTGKRS